ncbi:MAG: hypothetical protein KGZ92_03640 [Firmicutes bacterium]|nr:hypothetical protein [Dethiobacter sp.]MBS3888382.1 hypothetical protein [Bacillota bacterium]
MAARVLATGRAELVEGIAGQHIGSYGLVYGSVCVVVPIVGMLRMNLIRHPWGKFAALVALLLCTICSAGLFMALLLVVVAYALNVVNAKNSLRGAVLLSIAVVSLLFSAFPLHGRLTYFGHTVAHPALSMRVNEFAYALQQGTFEGTVNMLGRWSYSRKQA